MELILFKIFIFLLSILILVSLHELGHLIIARLFNVKVIRYSIGFGKPIFTKTLKGIQWSISLIPLGGYVKMLDTREGFVKDEDLKFAFDKQHPFKRILIVFAGPFVNLILAIIIYIFVFSFGVKDLNPIIATVVPGSISQKIGLNSMDRILKINNHKINSFEEGVYSLFSDLDSENKVSIDIVDKNNNFRTIKINTINYKDDIKVAFKNHDIGIYPFKFTTIISKILLDSPADKAGLKLGDKIEFVDGKNIKNWFDFNTIVKNNGGRVLNIGISRISYNFDQIINTTPGMVLKDKLISKVIKLNFKIIPDIIEVDKGSRIKGHIGIAPKIEDLVVDEIYSNEKLRFNDILRKSFEKTWFHSKLILNLFINLVLGKASLSNIGGPVSIANVTSDAIKVSIFAYLDILALLSISLGILNILPIPPLDGGNILYCVLEWIKGKPLSERLQGIGLKIGMMIIFLLVIISLINDFKNVLGS